jgi:hypothetical protein
MKDKKEIINGCIVFILGCVASAIFAILLHFIANIEKIIKW